MFRSRAAASRPHSTPGQPRRASVGAIALAAVAALGLTLGPASAAHADVSVSTVADLALAFSTEVSGSTITLSGDVTGDSTSPAVKVPAGRTLTLDLNGHELTLVGDDDVAGLGVPAGTSLTIRDSASLGTPGTLDAFGGWGGAGIGGADGEASGTITIDGGTVTAHGGFAGAAIGGGWGGDGGVVTINGGTVTAMAGDMAAGIGGGHSGDGGTTNINGGTVTANATTDGTALGSGVGGAGGFITIGADAVVTTTSTASEGVIGLGGPSLGSLSNAGTLNIPAFNYFKIPAGVTVTNSGTINLGGVIEGSGGIEGSGAIANTGTIAGGYILIPDNVTGHNTTVVLEGNGGTAPTDPARLYAATFQAGQVAFPAAATRTGYTFAGWFTDPEGGTELTGTTDLGLGGPKSITLYAQWGTPAPADDGTSPTLPATGADHLSIWLTGGALTIVGLALFARRRFTAID